MKFILGKEFKRKLFLVTCDHVKSTTVVVLARDKEQATTMAVDLYRDDHKIALSVKVIEYVYDSFYFSNGNPLDPRVILVTRQQLLALSKDGIISVISPPNSYKQVSNMTPWVTQEIRKMRGEE